MTRDDSLSKFGAYRKALELFELVVTDLSPFHGEWTLGRLIGQQYASADSVASNIEEGYGRGSPKDYAHFLIISRGSAQETAGRYQRFKHWLPSQTIEARVALSLEIIGILTASIGTLRAKR